eukprot:5470913-Amphidinium_carterae.1
MNSERPQLGTKPPCFEWSLPLQVHVLLAALSCTGHLLHLTPHLTSKLLRHQVNAAYALDC